MPSGYPATTMISTPSDLADGVPFSFLVSLLREISKVQPHKVKDTTRRSNHDYPVKDIFMRWTNHLRRKFSPLPHGTTAIVFRLLFPHEDNRRKYDMQEPRLAQALSQALGIEPSRFKEWSHAGGTGCLGEEIKLIVEKTCPDIAGHISPLSIAQVDELLDELAALSGYTHSSIRSTYPSGTRRSRVSILKSLFSTLSPLDAGFLTQIILKDLRPLLYPLQESQMHYASALLDYNTKGIKMLSEQDALRVWDSSGWMLRMYRVRSTLDEVADEFEKPLEAREIPGPRLGTMVTLPKSEKGRSPRYALKLLSKSKQIWAEMKYDGERAQIHVEILQHGSKPKITIFSKSKRDSTLDRKGVHETILSALGLWRMGGYVQGGSKVKTGIILDAEMVACNGENIDEFWRIRGLIERSAYGIRRSTANVDVPESESQSCEDSQLSMLSANVENRHLALVFFDILSLNSVSLLSMPYSQRREILEAVITTTPGEAMLSERTLISKSSSQSLEDSILQLDSVFARCISHSKEGLVLKADESKYHDWRMPWIKLKRDYIPGYGDALDMCLVGAGWDKDRARELRVGTDAFTTFYIGGIKPGARPHLHIYFIVSYGLSRQQLEEINFMIKSSCNISYDRLASHNREELAYTFDLFHGIPKPSVLLQTPMLTELVGAGFTKSPGGRHYELRFPRLTKIHRPTERCWTTGVNLSELHQVACAAVGRDPSEKVAKDAAAEIWGKPCSPGAKSSLKRKATTEFWEERLAKLDGRKRQPGSIRNWEGPSSEDEEPQAPSQGKRRGDVLHAVTNTPVKKAEVHVIDLCTPSPKTPVRKVPICIPSSSSCSENLHHISSPPPGNPMLNNAVVWIAKSKEQPSHHSSANLPCRRLHSLQSLLATCGWFDSSSAGGVCWSHVERGIIILEAGWEGYITKTIKGMQSADNNIGLEPGRKPIYLFDGQAGLANGEPLYCFN